MRNAECGMRTADLRTVATKCGFQIADCGIGELSRGTRFYGFVCQEQAQDADECRSEQRALPFGSSEENRNTVRKSHHDSIPAQTARDCLVETGGELPNVMVVSVEA